ncbi:MAG TPA: ABC transporter permease [Longimicrobiales bacterium]|jgi:predicted permease
MRRLRVALRRLALDPGLSVISVTALALGIGLTATMFSITYAALFRGLPFDEPSELVTVYAANPSTGSARISPDYHDFLAWREEGSAFEDLAAYTTTSADLSDGEGYPERVAAAHMTPGIFTLLGVQPVAGRLYGPDEDAPGAEPVAVIGHALWRTRYGSSMELLGSAILVNGEPRTVVGVLPPGFGFPEDQQFWMPLGYDPVEVERGRASVRILGRLLDGVDAEVATSRLRVVSLRLARQFPETNEGVEPRVVAFTKEFFADDEVAFLYSMLGAGFLVLLVACANVANLLLARATDRSREVAVRSALGAARARIVGQLLGETLVLAILGAVAGTGLALLGVKLFNDAIVSVDMPFWIDIRVDPTILGFILGLAAVSALAAGLLPALRASSAAMGEILKDEGRGTSSLHMGRTSRAMVVAGVALAFPLLVGAGLVIKSVTRLKTTDLGFETESVLTARVSLRPNRYGDPAARMRFFEDVRERLAGLPGVQSAALTTNLPGGWGRWMRFGLEGEEYLRDVDRPTVLGAFVTPGFLESLDVQVVAGRGITGEDRAEGAPVGVVNLSFVERFLDGGDALGRQILVDGEEMWRTVVGVVPDLRVSGLENREPWGLYVPLAQVREQYSLFLMARVRGEPRALAASLRQAVLDIDPDQPVYDVRTLDDAIQEGAWFYNVFGWVFSIFGVVALFLAAVGLYGVISFTVAKRTREMGMRKAMGASGADLIRLIVGRGMRQVALGGVLGLVLALFASRFLTVVLFQVEPRDPATFVAVTVVLALTGVTACLVPALRAVSLDPAEALRFE